MGLKKQSWHTINRRRNTMLRKWLPKFRRTYKEWASDITNQIRQNSVNGIDEFIDRQPTQVFYFLLLEFYTDVGRIFGLAAQNDAKAYRPGLEIKDLIEDQWIAIMTEYLNNEAADLVVTIQETPKTEAKRIIANITEEATITGEGIIGRTIYDPSVSKKIAAAFRSEWGQAAEWMGRRIAQTEMIRASNYATVRSVDLLDIPYQKAWLVGRDGKERESHSIAGLENTNVPQNQPFIVGGHECQYPGDPNLPAEESINCRCAYTAFPID